MKCAAAVTEAFDPIPCPACKGSGKTGKTQLVECPRCKGTGSVPSLTVTHLNRKRCPACSEDCDGKLFKPSDSLVLKMLARA